MRHIGLLAVTVLLLCCRHTLASAQGSFSASNLSTGGKDVATDPHGQTVFIAGHEYLIRSTDGGLTWSATETPYLYPERVIVRFDDPQTVIVAKSGEIAYSTAAGSGPWSIALHDDLLIPLRFAQSLVNPSIVFLTRERVDSAFTLWWSPNGGHDWLPDTQFAARKSLFDITMHPDSADTNWRDMGYVSGQTGVGTFNEDGFWQGIYHRMHQTYFWMFTYMLYPPLHLDMTSVAVVPSLRPSSSYPIRYVAASVPSGRDTIFSNDDMSSSQRIPIFWEADSIRMIRPRRSTTHLFVATERGIFRSLDAGVSWHQANVGLLDTNIQAIAVPDAGNRVFAVGSSASFVSTNNGDSWQQVITTVPLTVPGLPENASLHQNYPNPFNPATMIGFDLPEDSRVDLVVLDLLGRQVAVLIDGERSAGRHNVTFDASGLASGVYFYRLQAISPGGAHAFRDVRKLLLVR